MLIGFAEIAYSPRFVTEVVDGVQRVDRGDTRILQTDDQVPKILVLGHAEGVLAHQDEVRPERPGVRAAEGIKKENQGRNENKFTFLET